MKKISIVIISLIAIMTFTISNVYAVHGSGGGDVDGTHGPTSGPIGETFGTGSSTINPDNFKPNVTTTEAGDAIGLAQKIIGAINVVGTIILVITVIVLGIKYMTGSVEQKADYKKTMIPVLVGALLLFGTSWIIKFIYDIIPNTVSSIS